jgi:hypothetical protein
LNGPLLILLQEVFHELFLEEIHHTKSNSQ